MNTPGRYKIKTPLGTGNVKTPRSFNPFAALLNKRKKTANQNREARAESGINNRTEIPLKYFTYSIPSNLVRRGLQGGYVIKQHPSIRVYKNRILGNRFTIVPDDLQILANKRIYPNSTSRQNHINYFKHFNIYSNAYSNSRNMHMRNRIRLDAIHKAIWKAFAQSLNLYVRKNKINNNTRQQLLKLVPVGLIRPNDPSFHTSYKIGNRVYKIHKSPNSFLASPRR
jgi:hypothetical protein